MSTSSYIRRSCFTLCLVAMLMTKAKGSDLLFNSSTAHSSAVTGINLFPNLAQIVTTSLDGNFKVWNLEGSLLYQGVAAGPITGMKLYINSSSAGSNLLFLMANNSVYALNANDYSIRYQFGHPQAANGGFANKMVILSNTHFIIGGCDGSSNSPKLYKYNLNDGSLNSSTVTTFPVGSEIKAMTLSEDNMALAVSSDMMNITDSKFETMIYNPMTLAVREQWNLNNMMVNDMAFTKDHSLYTVSSDRTVRGYSRNYTGPNSFNYVLLNTWTLPSTLQGFPKAITFKNISQTNSSSDMYIGIMDSIVRIKNQSNDWKFNNTQLYEGSGGNISVLQTMGDIICSGTIAGGVLAQDYTKEYAPRTNNPNNDDREKDNTLAVILGAIFGSIGGIFVIAIIGWCCYTRYRANLETENAEKMNNMIKVDKEIRRISKKQSQIIKEVRQEQENLSEDSAMDLKKFVDKQGNENRLPKVLKQRISIKNEQNRDSRMNNMFESEIKESRKETSSCSSVPDYDHLVAQENVLVIKQNDQVINRQDGDRRGQDDDSDEENDPDYAHIVHDSNILKVSELNQGQEQNKNDLVRQEAVLDLDDEQNYQ